MQQGFFDSFYAFLTYDTNNRKVFGGYTICGTGYIASGRDMLCQKFITTNAEWLMMVDWDITFTPESVYALLDAADPIERPIIAGCYVTWFGDGDPVLRPCWMQERDGEEFVAPAGLEVGRVVECTTVGMGFTLIHRSVLESLAELHADDPWRYFGHDIIGESRVGEDLTFCKRARNAGFSVWGHGGVLLGHTKAKTFVAADIADPSMARMPTPLHLPPKSNSRVLNVGGGSKDISIPETYTGWDHILVDIDAKPGVDLVMDARKLAESSEVDEASFDAVYCSHNLEHFHAHDVPTVLAGFKRVVKAGGTVDIRVPDIGAVTRAIADGADLDDEAYVSPAGPILYRDMIYGFGKEIEKSGHDYYCHRTGFTKDRLTNVLVDAGFQNVVVEQCDGFELRATATR